MLCLSLVAFLVGQADAAVAESVKVYRGPNGQLVDVVMLKPVSENRALVRVRNADSPHDGLVLPCEVRRDSRGAKFVARHDGSGWTVMSEQAGAGDVEIPGRPGFRVKFDKAATEDASAKDVLAAHDTQKRDGTLRLFERKSYPNIEAKYEARAAEASQKVGKACGRDVAIVFDWGSFDDEIMAEVDAWKACEPIVGRLERSCAVAKEAKTIVCRMGTAFGLKIDGDRLVFTTTPKGKDGAAGFLAGQK